MSNTPVLGVGAPVAIPGTNWGDLGGTLANQTDLQAALDGKQDAGVPIIGAVHCPDRHRHLQS